MPTGSPPLFANRCPLCGARTNGAYCHAHSWAAGERLDPRPPTDRVPLQLVAGATTGSGRRLVRKAV